MLKCSAQWLNNLMGCCNCSHTTKITMNGQSIKFIKITRPTNGWPANASNLNLSQQSKSVQHQLECLWVMATCFYLPFFIHSPATYWIYVRCSLIFYDLILCLHQILPAFFKTFSLFLSVELLSNNPRWILMFL